MSAINLGEASNKNKSTQKKKKKKKKRCFIDFQQFKSWKQKPNVD